MIGMSSTMTDERYGFVTETPVIRELLQPLTLIQHSWFQLWCVFDIWSES